MKKFISYLLVAVLCLSCLAACNKQKPVDDNPSTTATPAPTTKAPDQPTAAPTDAPAADDSAEALAAAKDYLFAMYKDKQGVTASDYERVAVLNIGGNKFTVTWTSNAGSDVKIVAGDKFTTIDINETTNKDVDYVLTATIADANGNKITQDFTHKIPAYKETSWAEYAAAEKGSTVICTGVVTGIIAKSNGNSSNALYFQDNDGGYYAYNLGSDPITDLGLKTGMTVKVTGTKDIYSGTYEIINSKVDIVDSSIKTVAPADYTEIFKAAANLKAAELTEKQSLFVTVKGVEITGQDTSSGYYKFKLGNNESYIRISSSVCPIVKQKDEFIAAHTEHNGWIADATGILCLYDGAFYLTPATLDAFNYISLPVKSDAEMVEFEAAKLSFADKYTADTKIDLNSNGKTYKDVTIEWATNNTTYADIVDGQLILVIPAESVTVSISATIKSGTAKRTEVFDIVLAPAPGILSTGETLAQAFALEEGKSMNGKQVLRGVITEITTPYSDQYNNITLNIKVNDKIVNCYRLAGGKELKVGDKITVTGEISNYKGTVQFKAGSTYSKSITVDDAKQLLVVEKASELDHNKYLDGKQVLSGEVIAIPTAYSDQYNNITVNIKVGDKTVQCYRLAGGKDIVVGDKITVTGYLGMYNGNIQFKAGAIYERTINLAEAKSRVVLEEAEKLGKDEDMTGIQEVVGVVKSINTAYSDQYDNITITLAVGDKTIQAYRLKGGKDIELGEKIMVSGIITNFRGTTLQFKAGATYTADFVK